MKKNAIIYIDDTQAQVTKAFAKQARIFGTPEYREWRAYEIVPDDITLRFEAIQQEARINLGVPLAIRSTRLSRKEKYNRLQAILSPNMAAPPKDCLKLARRGERHDALPIFSRCAEFSYYSNQY